MQRKPWIDRFERYIRRDASGCWTWTSSGNPQGYGLMYVGNYVYRSAHREAYEHFVGPISYGLTLDHLCRNRRCCNPDHLEPVTQRVNTLRGDTVSGRNARKTACPKGHLYDMVSHLAGGKEARRCSACRSAQQRARTHR